ncbi:MULTISPECIES: hypothetical protein [Paenibacillus]|uniref:hypothetical protein n=1 Tax=Paenibacillus TaxID=44249 RepID=UPI00096DC388|nr:hypothetical protein [Paenibacillus odorifer]OMD81176.1 hypothetical protein BSK53_19355 [Paenibacillus odorifer]
MDEYFQYIVENLDAQDIQMLRLLSNEGATAKYKSIFNKILLEKSGMSEAKYRNVTVRLMAMKFIEANTTFKDHSLFINSYGEKALKIIIERES